MLIDAESGRVLRIISLQYNPEKMTRTLQVQGAGGEGGNRSEAMRFKGPAVETFKLEADIDAADQLEFPDQYRSVVENGIQPQVSVLESLATRQRSVARPQLHVAVRHTGDRADGGAAGPVCVGQKPHRTG